MACLGGRESVVRHKLLVQGSLLKASWNQMLTHLEVPSVYANTLKTHSNLLPLSLTTATYVDMVENLHTFSTGEAINLTPRAAGTLT